ncbi:histidine kinase [Streptomyces sp. NPDC050617]|uniref:sensor histidine kinase n=1 Tax=Streptomyces sp. NPDC050617 TaxID=3154628 RepID=UPI0034259E97
MSGATLPRVLGRAGRGAGSWAVDAVITAIVQAAVTIPFVVPRAADVPPATWAAYGVTTLSVLPLLWRSRAPFTVLVGIVVAGFAYVPLDGPGQPLPYSPLVAVFTVAAEAGRRQRRAALLLSLPLVTVGTALHTDTAREYLFAFFVFAAAYALGALTRVRQAYTAAVEQRAEAAERARRAAAERAAERERARIAREMHDVLAHAVSVMVVQAEAGPLAVRADPDRAEAAFDAIADAGRDAMTQLRRMLGVLKDEAPEDGARSARVPQPSLADLPELVEQVRRTGLEVALETVGEAASPSADVQVTAYRVVQEALTNVLKHADAAAATVRLGWAADRLTITVTDDGTGGPRPPGRASGRTGQGLIGIRERAAAHGGAATAGPAPDGRGFAVAVGIPLVISSPVGVG